MKKLAFTIAMWNSNLQLLKQEPNQQETEQKAQCFLSSFDKYCVPALAWKSQPRKVQHIVMWRLL